MRTPTFESFAADPALFARFVAVFEQGVFLEVVAFFEADGADRTDERTLVGVRALVVLVGRVLRELLAADVARPVTVASRRRGGRRGRRQKDRHGALEKRRR